VPDENPFLRYRDRLDSHAVALAGGMSDDQFIAIVQDLDAAVAAVDGHGFRITPTVETPELATAAGLDVDLRVKIEVDQVGGSHKARHLVGVALHLLVDEALGAAPAERLAIASCGNAALAAGVIARALDRSLEVFVPPWADRPVIERLGDLGADIHVCERREGEAGDPCYQRFGEAVASGARAFSVQGTDTPTTFDGGRTIGWELAEQAPDLDVIYVQVGGGALATATSLGLGDVRLHPVQAAGCAPLRRAWDRLAPDFDWAAAAERPDDFMWPWEAEPASAASGILDDVTYDWLPLLERTHATGGEPIVAVEATIVRAHELATSVTDVAVSATGTAGLAGLLTAPPAAGSRVAVLFTGVERDDASNGPGRNSGSGKGRKNVADVPTHPPDRPAAPTGGPPRRSDGADIPEDRRSP
jgi:threonine synthase